MEMAKEWYEQWFDSPYYHQLYFKRDEKEADAFIRRLVKHLNPPAGSTMLDVACGKGRHSLGLANLGFDVTGIDLSHHSIKEAKKFEKENLHFYEHDMRQPFRINYFDYAFNFFTSFGYFDQPREHDAAIRTIAQSVHLNGTLVIDYLNVHYAEDRLIHEGDIDIDDYHFHITKWMNESHFYKIIKVEHPGLPEPKIFKEQVAKFSLGDFTDMLAYQGMQIREVFGTYDLGSYHVRNTPRMIMIAKKIKPY